MKKLFIACMIIVSVFAEDVFVDYYKNHGLRGLEEMFDTTLTQESYWRDVVKKQDLTFGYIEKYDNILVCDKSNSTLTLYQKDPNGKWLKQNNFNAFTGKNKGDKQTEGDLKTPVGIYNLVQKLSKVDSFYGPMAFVTSYPNLYDRYLHKEGHGIWIHGLPINNQKRDSFTKGCIAINNDDLCHLDEDINLDKTLLLIYEDNPVQQINPEIISQILANLYQWLYAWKYNQFDDYIAFYNKDFIRYDGKNLQQFKAYKKRIFKKHERKKIRFTNINVIPYPNHKDMYQITFFEFYKSDSFRFMGNKELLVYFKDGKLSIFSEK